MIIVYVPKTEYEINGELLIVTWNLFFSPKQFKFNLKSIIKMEVLDPKMDDHKDKLNKYWKEGILQKGNENETGLLMVFSQDDIPTNLLISPIEIEKFKEEVMIQMGK